MPTVSPETDQSTETDLPKKNQAFAIQRPAGTVTFLFSDIEGSTRLWENFPDAMQAVLARHDALMRQSIEARDGWVFKTVGDAFYAAFTHPQAALAAALTAQKALHSETWGLPDGSTIRVRLALHLGPAEQRGGDYFGAALGRTARLLSAAHGGQTLISETLASTLEDEKPDEVSLRSLGRHRLKDLAQPLEIFQVATPGLPDEFPALRSLESFAHNLPGQLTSFIGRELEMADARAALKKSRLVMLCGPGGSGKTRLALQVAAEALDDYADGVWLVELAPIADPSLVPQAVAAVLGIREVSERRLRQTLLDTLRPKSLLLILDNCEHLIDASARLAESLLQACPTLTILATSREALDIGGETLLPLSSLSMPPLLTSSLPLPPLEKLLECEAIRLFVDRATAALPTFRFSTGNSAAVAAVCSRLDGIPLALELAAARVKVLSPEQIADRLDDRFRLLSGGNRTALPRQQTLRALLDWSYDLLAPTEQTLLRRLSVFAGGWSLDAAESVCAKGEVEGWEVLDLLSHLVAKSLVVVEPPFEGQVRYHLQENLRQYAAEKLTETDESAALVGQHRAWFLTYAEAAEPNLSGPQHSHWLNCLERDHDNFRAALRSSQKGAPELLLRLAGALSRFWFVRSYLTEGLTWLETALAQPSAFPESVTAKVLNGAGMLAWSCGDFPKAQGHHDRDLEIRRAINDKRGIARALANLGILASEREEFARAKPLMEESLAFYRELGDKSNIAIMLSNLGSMVGESGDHTQAIPLLQESLTTFRFLEDLRGIASASHNLGSYLSQKHLNVEAVQLFRESLMAQKLLGDKQRIISTLNGVGSVALDDGNYERACILLSAAKSLSIKSGIPTQMIDLSHYGKDLTALHEVLNDERFSTFCLVGGQMSQEEAINFALQ